MEKFKDILYNKNDILIALAILIVAAIIIFWRIDVIMNYPKVLIAQSETEASKDKDNTSTIDTDQGSSAASPAKPSQSNETKDNEDTNDGLWTGNKLTSAITITIKGGSATGAVSSLVNVGIFDSYEDYEKVCHSHGYDPLAIKATTFTFPAGTTKAQIAKTITD